METPHKERPWVQPKHNSKSTYPSILRYEDYQASVLEKKGLDCLRLYNRHVNPTNPLYNDSFSQNWRHKSLFDFASTKHP
jgi:hypothetical protein